MNDHHDRAARAYASHHAHRADPFAYRRMLAHLALGIESADEVLKQYGRKAA